MYQFVRSDTPPGNLRNDYLDGLSEHQEFFLEELVATGQAWCLPDRAYVVLCGTQIVEFHVDRKTGNDASAIFEAARTVTGARSALCKSFDPQLLFPALARPARVTATGILFRSFSDQPSTSRPDLNFRMAETADIDAVAAFNDDFFENSQEIERFVKSNTLHLLLQDGTIVGCGTQTRVNPGRPAIDLGMLVAPAECGRGFGSHIIAHMKNQVLKRGLSPVCGCAARNVASHRALLKAGFHGNHRLLRIEFETE
jgi:RimJ/RimL family protein N-acetyltransferase